MGFLDHSFLFCRTQSSRMGNKKLVTHIIFRDTEYSHVRSRSYIYDYHCRLFIYRSYVGGILSDRWVQKNIRGRVYTGAIGLGMTIPALMLLGFGESFMAVVGAGLLFGIGFGIFDANNMPILCQFISAKYRGTAYGIMNMTGVFAGAAVTEQLGKWTDGGNLGIGFALLSIVVLAALLLQVYFLRPKTDNME